MKSIKYILVSVIIIAVSAHPSLAINLTISNYYPSSFGVYDKYQLIPRADLTTPCVIGTIYANPSGAIQYCRDVSGTGVWGSIPDVWLQTSDTIYLTDIAVNSQLRVGVGTKTPEFKLHLVNDAGILARGTYGSGATLPSLPPSSRFIWYPPKAALRAGYVSGTQWDDANIGNLSVAFGKNTTASGVSSTITGGEDNTASGLYATVGGGFQNSATQRAAIVLGGKSNTASGQWSTVVGGNSNSSSGDYSVIAGGTNNSATANYSTVGGGEQNAVSSPYSSIGGGFQNSITLANGAEGFSVIAGGRQNTISSDYDSIAGGYNNSIQAPYVTILGGTNNSTAAITRAGVPVSPNHSVMLGGENNIASGSGYSVIAGSSVSANSLYGVAIGGSGNKLGTQDGAANNDNQGSVLIGGQNNILGGQNSAIVAGGSNYVWGDYSWAGGYQMKLGSSADPANHSFLWGYYSGANPPVVGTDDAFMIATGRVGISDLDPQALLEINEWGTTQDYMSIGKAAKGDTLSIKKDASAITHVRIGSGNASPTNSWDFATANNAYLSTGGVWTNASSRSYKENIQPISSNLAENVLEKLKPVSFRFHHSKEHIAGFIAEEVPAEVSLNERNAISAMDIIAVLVKSVQDQDVLIHDQEQELQQLENMVKKLEHDVKNKF